MTLGNQAAALLEEEVNRKRRFITFGFLVFSGTNGDIG